MDDNDDNKELIAALVKFQGGMTAIPRNRTNPFFKSKYAGLDDLWEVIRQPLAANGLAVVQTTSVVDGLPCLVTTLHHTSGGSLQGVLPLGVGREPSPQAMGSAITYARRYSLAAILGLTPDDDDDAEEATPRNVAPRDVPKGQPLPPVGGRDHWCDEHQRDFFKTAKMKAYAHPNDDGSWHSEPKVEPDTSPGPTMPAAALGSSPALGEQRVCPVHVGDKGEAVYMTPTGTGKWSHPWGKIICTMDEASTLKMRL